MVRFVLVSLLALSAAAWAQFAGHAGARSQNADRDTEANPDGAADVVASAVSPESSWPMAAQSGAALHEP